MGLPARRCDGQPVRGRGGSGWPCPQAGPWAAARAPGTGPRPRPQAGIGPGRSRRPVTHRRAVLTRSNTRLRASQVQPEPARPASASSPARRAAARVEGHRGGTCPGQHPPEVRARPPSRQLPGRSPEVAPGAAAPGLARKPQLAVAAGGGRRRCGTTIRQTPRGASTIETGGPLEHSGRNGALRLCRAEPALRSRRAGARGGRHQQGNITADAGRPPQAAGEQSREPLVSGDDDEGPPAAQVTAAGRPDPVKDYLDEIGKVPLLNAAGGCRAGQADRGRAVRRGEALRRRQPERRRRADRP